MVEGGGAADVDTHGQTPWFSRRRKTPSVVGIVPIPPQNGADTPGKDTCIVLSSLSAEVAELAPEVSRSRNDKKRPNAECSNRQHITQMAAKLTWTPAMTLCVGTLSQPSALWAPSTLSAGTLYPLGTPQPLPQRPHRLRVPYPLFPLQ